MHGGRAHRRRSCWLIAPSPHRDRGGARAVASSSRGDPCRLPTSSALLSPSEPARTLQSPPEPLRARQSPSEPARALQSLPELFRVRQSPPEADADPSKGQSQEKMRQLPASAKPAVLCCSFPHASLSNYTLQLVLGANRHPRRAPPYSIAAAHTRPRATVSSHSRCAPTATTRAAPVRWQLRGSPFVIPVCQLKCW